MLGTRREIIVDGKTYKHPDEMPPEVRQRYERALQIERSGALPGDAKVTFQLNGKEYASVADLPLPLRWLATGLLALGRRRLKQASTTQPRTNLEEPNASSAGGNTALSLVKWLLTVVVLFAFYYWYQTRH